MAELFTGQVKWFNDAKGYGFIEHESGKDVFVHYSAIESEGFKTLKDGEQVDYELKQGEKGLHAARVIRSTALSATSPSSTEQVAPNLESGSVSISTMSVSSLIEVERIENIENSDFSDLATAAMNSVSSRQE